MFISIALPMYQVLCSPSTFPMLSDFFYSSSSLIIVSRGVESLCCPLNFGSTHHVRRFSLKTLWIVYPSESSSWNTPKLISFEILKGLYLLLSNFFEGWFNWIFLFSNHTLLPTFSPWEFFLFLSNCFFMFFYISSIAFVACSQLFYIPIKKSSTRGIPVWTMRSSFQEYLLRFNLNGVLSVAAYFLSLYWNSATIS